MKQLPIALLLIALLLSACTSPSTRQTLDHAEAIIEDYPDSALYLLESIDGTKLSGEAQARHALLLSQAYDKNYIDITDDSLIAIAKDYYTLTDNDYYRMLAAYYYALVHFNAYEYELAMASVLESKDLAEKQFDYISLARADALLTSIYSDTYNTEKALEYALANLTHSRKAGKQAWIANGYNTLAQSYIATGQYSKSLEYIDSALQTNGISESNAYNLSILAHAGNQNYKAIDSLYNLMSGYGILPHAAQYAYIAQAKFFLGDREEYKLNIEKAETTIESLQDSIEIAGVKRTVAINEKRLNDALLNSELLLDYTGRLFLDATVRPIHLAQIEYEKNNSKHIQSLRTIEQLRFKNITVSLISGIIILLLSLFILWHRHKNKLRELDHKYELFVNEYNALKIESSNKLKYYSENAAASLQRELIAKFSWLEKMGNIYLDASITSSGKKNFYKNFELSLRAVREPDFKSSLETLINSHRNGIISRIRHECPKITDSEISLIIYCCTGLSSRIIAFLLDKNENAVYAQKHRIKKKLGQHYPDIFTELSDLFC